MWSDIGHIGKRAPLAEVSGNEKGMTALLCRQAGENFDIAAPLHHDLVGAEQHRPFAVEAFEDRMLAILRNLRTEAFRYFETVVIGKTGHWKRFLDRGVPPARLAVDALETEIAADHAEPAAGARPFAQKLQTIGHRLSMQPDIGMEQDGIGADIGQQDRVIGIETGHVEGQALDGFMRRHVNEFKGTAGKRLDQGLRAGVEGGAAEMVEAFEMGRGTQPRFPDEQHLF